MNTYAIFEESLVVAAFKITSHHVITECSWSLSALDLQSNFQFHNCQDVYQVDAYQVDL